MNVVEEPQSVKADGGLYLGDKDNEIGEKSVASVHGGGACDRRGRLWREEG